ncbi:MAG TPA: hypothetical protein VFY10_15575 [Dehalococcoidia bacterium]|nr:hypothetical protein [Dehalococcoidia bacterium]
MKRLLLLTLVLILALAPASASAASNDEQGMILRVRGDVVIPQGESIGSVIVIDGNLMMAGTVKDLALVINGDATISGNVEGDLSVISGDIELTSEARVHNVTSVRGDLVQRDGSTVTGKVHERDSFRIAWAAVSAFGILFWVALTIALVAAALVFALIGGRQLTDAAHLMTGAIVDTVLGVVFLWVALPILAVLAIVTVVGVPLGVGILVFLMPALWFLGYIVAGTRFGMLMTSMRRQNHSPHPLFSASLGIFVLQLILLIPILGAIIGFFAGIWGAGALAFIAYKAAGGKGFSSDEGQPAAPPAPAV